jgi:Neuraminidase-like domain/Putative peptidoglycan binding domain/Salmonella virulence plasmid 28.1kDa A protein
MRPIQNPPPPDITFGDTGDHIVNLQDALLFLIDKGSIHVDNEDERDRLVAELRQDREQQTYRGGTGNMIIVLRGQYDLEPGELVDAPTAELINRLLDEEGAFAPPPQPQVEWVVRGQVVDAAGGVNGIDVGAFDRDLFSRPDVGDPGQKLGGWTTTQPSPETQEDGWFEIPYATADFAGSDIRSNSGDFAPDLLFLLTRGEQPLTQFEVYRLPDETLVSDDDKIMGFEARRVEEVRIVILDGQRPLSEYERLTRTLEPLLAGRSPADLDEANYRDISFIVRETGVEREQIEALIAAVRLAADPFAGDLRTEVFYGLARTRGLTDVVGLAHTSAADLRAGLIEAGALPGRPEKIIIPPFESEDELDQTVEHIDRLSIDTVLVTPPAEGKPTLGQLLSVTLPSTEQQVTLLREYVNHEGSAPEFWNKLRAHGDFQEPDQVQKVQFALQLGVLTRDNLTLMETIQSSGQFQSTRDMARMDAAELTDLVIQGAGEPPDDLPGETREEKLDLYAKAIVGLLQGAFPTETVAKVVATVPPERLHEVSPDALAQFFKLATDTLVVKAGEEFDIRSTHVNSFLGIYGDSIFTRIDEIGEDKERQKALTEQVKRAQRLFQISTSPETFQELMKTNLSSAHDIAQMSLSAFHGEVSHNPVGPEEAELIHRRALTASAASLNLALRAYQSATDVYPAVTGGGLKEVPHWAQLFGSLELCECDHCNSVYSPAAYFVDLLQYLGSLDKNEAGWTPLDVLVGNYDNADPAKHLQGKRPDLPHILLTCENTNTPIPYIDLVNEVLESYVAFGKLDQSTAKDTGESTAAELSANPQYVVEQAYVNLKAANFPVGLPFDQPLEVARAYLEQLGSARGDLMEAFARSDAGSAESRATAAEKLGISAREYEILTGEDFAGNPSAIHLSELFGFDTTPTLQLDSEGAAVVLLQAKLNTDGAAPPLALSGKFDALTETALKAFQVAHGLPDTGVTDADTWAALDTIKPDAVGALVTGVPQFLHRTQLRYVELIALLKTRFINPNQVALLKLENTYITYSEVRHLIETGFAAPSPEVQAKLAQAGLTLADVQQLIEELFHTVVLYAQTPDCALDDMLVQYLQVGQLYGGASLDDADVWKLQRFLRLWRTLGWTMPELDTALVSLGFTDQISGACIEQLAYINELHETLKLPIIKLLSLWVNINTHGDKALYNTLFQNKAVLNPPDPDLQLNPTRDELADTSKELTDKYPPVLAALGVRAADLDAIIEDAKPAGGKVTLANLSALYRYALLAKALRIPVRDLPALRGLGGASFDPFSASNPAPTADFIDLLARVKRLGFSVPQLDYIYRHQYALPTSLPPQQASVEATAKALSDGLKRIAEDNTLAPDPAGELTRSKLALLYDSATVDAIIGMIDGSAVYSAPLAALPAGIVFPDLVKNKIRYEATKLRFTGAMTDAERDNVLLPLSANTDYQASVNALYQQPRDLVTSALGKFLSPENAAALLNRPSLDADGKSVYLDVAGNPVALEQAFTTAIAVKFNTFLEQFLPYLRDNLSRALIKQTLSQALALDTEIASLLLENATVLQTAGGAALINDFLGLSAPVFTPAASASYERLHKIAMLVNTFKLSKAEVEYWHSPSSDPNKLNLNALPLAKTDDGAAFQQWQTLADYVTFRSSLPASEISLIDLFNTEPGLKRAKLADLTGWRVSDIEAAQDVLNLQDLNVVGSLLKIQQAIKLSFRTGIGIKQLSEWSAAAPDAAQAKQIKNVVKAQYDEETWLQVAKPLNDTLRESQRSALIAYVLAKPEIVRANVTDSNRLYEYFLIDVEMSACMATSRIKQAISSVQLFVQRCLLNLVPEVRPSAIHAHRWEWMKNYRVWEANRKVFLYPENWIEPELRDDKTPFFKQMESELMQTDLTNESAEEALLNYLYKLDQVARLEVCGMYLQEGFEAGEEYRSILHVIARSMGGATRSYYYRRLIDNRVWTPWEKVELDIQGTQGSDQNFADGVHVLPVVWNRRLYLFWLVFTQKAEKTSPPKDIAPPQPTPKQPDLYWEIRLAWSTYEKGKWSPKHISAAHYDDKIAGQLIPHVRDPRWFRLRAFPAGDGLVLQMSVFAGIAKGRFYLSDPRGEVVAGGDSGSTHDVRPIPTSPPYYMGFKSSGGMTLRISTDQDVPAVPILGSTPVYTFTPLSQHYGHPLQAPYFYQDATSVYFIRAREGVEDAVKKVEVPDAVVPPFKKYVFEREYDVRVDLGRPIEYSPAATVVNPWVSAERELSVQKFQQIAVQTGVML